MHTGAYRYRDFAIISGAIEEYGSYVPQIMEEFGIQMCIRDRTYKVTAPAEYKGLLFVLQTQRTAEEYENGIVKGLGTDEAHTFDGTINDGSVAIELDRDYEYINCLLYTSY